MSQDALFPDMDLSPKKSKAQQSGFLDFPATYDTTPAQAAQPAGPLLGLNCTDCIGSAGACRCLASQLAPDPWIKHPDESGHRKTTCWEHVSGWQVIHCGHPTANHPFYLLAPDRPETIVSFNGLGFKTAEIGRAVVQKLLTGAVVVRTDMCRPGCAWVPLTQLGEDPPPGQLAPPLPAGDYTGIYQTRDEIKARRVLGNVKHPQGLQFLFKKGWFTVLVPAIIPEADAEKLNRHARTIADTDLQPRPLQTFKQYDAQPAALAEAPNFNR